MPCLPHHIRSNINPALGGGGNWGSGAADIWDNGNNGVIVDAKPEKENGMANGDTNHGCRQ